MNKNDRIIEILKYREEGKTMAVIGDFFNISRQRVSQIILKYKADKKQPLDK